MKGHGFTFSLFFSLFILHFSLSLGCTCPGSKLSLDECSKYEIIFRGRIDSVSACEGKNANVYFEVLELYKGNSRRIFKVEIVCKDECAQAMNAGEEWIIYANYKQIDNGGLDWCSRSRKKIKHENEDFYAMNNGCTYGEELDFLRSKLGKHSLVKDAVNYDANRNIRPNTNQMIITLLCSLAGIVLFYYLFNKFFR